MDQRFSICRLRAASYGSVLGLFAITLLGGVVCELLTADEPAAQKPLVTISKETTRITAPLKPSGYPDYLAAINLRQKQGVKTERNGAVLLVQILGPKALQGRAREYFKELGMDPLPANVTYFESYSDYVLTIPAKRLPPPNEEERGIEDDDERLRTIRDRVESQLYNCLSRPWKRAENPLVASWIDSQQQLMAKLKELEQRDQWYHPWLAEQNHGRLFSSISPLNKCIHSISHYLAARMMLLCGEGNYTVAAEEIRFGLLLCQRIKNGPLLIDDLVSCAVFTHLVQQSLKYLVHHAPLGAVDLEILHKEFRRITPRKIARAVNENERYFGLDLICNLAEFGYHWTNLNNDVGDLQRPETIENRGRYDFDLMMTQIDQYHDLWMQISEIQDRKTQLVAIKEFFDRLKSDCKNIESNSLWANIRLNSMTREARSKVVTAILARLLYVPTPLAAARRMHMLFEMQEISFALARFHAKHGKYPLKFTELAEEGIIMQPFDLDGEATLTYRSDGKDFLMYSVGYDDIDHGGFSSGNFAGENFDDYAIFSPNWEPKEPKLEEPNE